MSLCISSATNHNSPTVVSLRYDCSGQDIMQVASNRLAVT